MGIFSKFKKGFSKGSALLQGAFERVTARGGSQRMNFLTWRRLFTRAILVQETTEDIISRIKEEHKNNKDFRGEDIRKIARSVLVDVLKGSEGRLEESSGSKPEVICLIGVNGSGKTTTCAKLGYRFTENHKSALLGACDTFRAAATEQLKSWASRLGMDLVSAIMGQMPLPLPLTLTPPPKQENVTTYFSILRVDYMSKII